MRPSVKFVSSINGSLSQKQIMGQLWLVVVVRWIMDLVVVAVGGCPWWWLSCGSDCPWWWLSCDGGCGSEKKLPVYNIPTYTPYVVPQLISVVQGH